MNATISPGNSTTLSIHTQTQGQGKACRKLVMASSTNNKNLKLGPKGEFFFFNCVVDLIKA